MSLTNGKHFWYDETNVIETGCEKEKYPQSRDVREDAFGVSVCRAAVKLTLELRTEGFCSRRRRYTLRYRGVHTVMCGAECPIYGNLGGNAEKASS